MVAAIPHSYHDKVNYSASRSDADEMSASINCSLSNASNVLCEDLGEHMLRLPWPVFWLTVIILLALVGNALVCISVWYEPRLQNMFNFFLVSLAVGDMLDSIMVMPLAVAKAYLGGLFHT